MRAITGSSLKSPAAIAAIVAVTVVFGLVSLYQIPKEGLPQVERPEIDVQTDWRAQTPREVEAQIVEPEEQVLEGLPGLQEMEGRAGFGEGRINLKFLPGADMDKTLADVVNRLGRIQSLPVDAQKPLAQLGNATDRNAILISLFLQNLHGDKIGVADSEFVRDTVAPALQQIPGVGSVQYTGQGVADELQILFNPMRAAQLGIQIPRLTSQIGNSDDVSGGALEAGRHRLGISFRGRYSIDDLKKTVLDWRSGNPILLGDIADVQVGQARSEGFAYFDGHPALEIDVFRAPGANDLQTVGNIKAELQRLNEQEAKDRNLVLRAAGDPTPFIWRALDLAGFDILVGIALAVLVVWYFLHDWRCTAIVASLVPLCIAAILFFLWLWSAPLNVVSLAAIAVGVGVILDAAVLVMENILRLREAGADIRQSAHDGTHQVWRALFASTAASMAVFLPLIFLSGPGRQLFSGFAIIVAIAMLISVLAAISVVPAAFVHVSEIRPRADPMNRIWSALADRAMRLTATARERRYWILGFIAASVLGIVLWAPSLRYLPRVKAGSIDVSLQYSPGTTQTYAEQHLAAPLIDRMSRYVMTSGAVGDWSLKSDQSGRMGATLWLRNEEAAARVERSLRENVLGELDAAGFVSQNDLFGGAADDAAISVDIQSQDIDSMRNAARAGADALGRTFPGMPVAAEPALAYDQPQLELVPNDRAISEAGWTRADVAAIVQALGAGLYIGQRFDDGEQLYLILKSAQSRSPTDFQNTPVATPQNDVMYLARLVNARHTLDSSSIYTLNGLQTYTLRFQAPVRSGFGNTISKLQATVLPQIRAAMSSGGNVTWRTSGEDRDTIVWLIARNLLLAGAVLLAITGVLFRSLIDVAIVALVLPLCVVGGLFGLRVLNLFAVQPLDLFSVIAFVVVLSLATTTIILLIVRTREGEAEGLSREAAVRSALETRVRPICTGGLTVAAALFPLVAIPGPGAEIYRGVGAIVLGGTLVSNLFTIFLVPALLRIDTSRAAARTRAIAAFAVAALAGSGERVR